MSTKKVSQVSHTEIRIGIADSTHELNMESNEDQATILNLVTVSLNSSTALVIVDVKGRETIVPHNRIAFVEIGELAERRVGFATV
jgi:hypothetical protein